MPCIYDGPTEADARLRECYKLHAVYNEVIRREGMNSDLYNSTNPYKFVDNGGDPYGSLEKAEMNRMTKKVCETMGAMAAFERQLLSLEAQLWYRDHVARDEERAKRTAERKRRGNVRREAWAKINAVLTAEEIGLLGLRPPAAVKSRKK